MLCKIQANIHDAFARKSLTSSVRLQYLFGPPLFSLASNRKPFQTTTLHPPKDIVNIDRVGYDYHLPRLEILNKESPSDSSEEEQVTLERGGHGPHGRVFH